MTLLRITLYVMSKSCPCACSFAECTAVSLAYCALGPPVFLNIMEVRPLTPRHSWLQDDEFGTDSSYVSEDEWPSDDEMPDLYCIACNRQFKSQSTYVLFYVSDHPRLCVCPQLRQRHGLVPACTTKRPLF